MNGKPYGNDEYAEPLRPELLTLPFDQYTLKDCQDIIKSRADARSQKAIAFYNGDHWQAGAGWIGPMYPEGHKLYQETLALLQRAFISHNVISEMVDRHVDGVLSRELHWSLLPKEEPEPIEEEDPITGKPIQKPGVPDTSQQALIQEAQAALVTWWNERNVLETLKRALAGLLNVQRSPLRFSVPPGKRDQDGYVTAGDLPAALDLLYLDHMGFDDLTMKQILPTATVWENKDMRESIGIFTYKVGEEDRAELSYLDENGDTVLRVIDEKGNITEPVQLPLGGRILMYEMTRKALISEQIMSQQRSLNKTLSMKDRNDTQGGFLERFLINVKWPTKKVTKLDGSVVEEREPMYSGGASLNVLVGDTFTDENGVVHTLTPNVIFRDPVPASTFIESADHTYTGMLQEGKQLHYAQKDLAISGASKKESRQEYTKDLQNSGNVIEGLVRWILETALTEAAMIAGQPGRFESLRAYVKAHIDPGPVEPDDMRVASEMHEKGIWDWETTASATGIDDVDAVKQRIEQEEMDENAKMLAFAEQAQPPAGDDEEEDEEGEPLSERAARLAARAGR